MRRMCKKDAKKASYDDLEAIKDFVRLSRIETACSNESSVSNGSSTMQGVGDRIKAESSFTDIDMCSLSTLTEECIMVPIDGYLVDEECELNDSAQEVALDNAEDSSRQASTAAEKGRDTDERESKDTDSNALRSPKEHVCNTKGHSSTSEQTAFTDYSLGIAISSSSSSGHASADASSGDLSSNTAQQQSSRDKQNQRCCLERSPKNHELQTIIQKNSSEEGRISGDDGGSFHKHIVRYDPQVLSSKKHSLSKVVPRIHEVGSVEVQSFKRFPGFKGSGKIARIPKAADVLYVVKDVPELSGPWSHNKASSPLTDALEIIRKEQTRARDSQVVNRFFIGPVLSSLDINDTAEFSDYRNRNLYDIVEKKGSWGKMTKNYIKVVNGKFICYKSKSMRLTENVVSSDYFHSPDDIYSYYPEKYTLDLKESQLYVITGKSIHTLVPCRSCYYALNKNMEEISNVDIMQITRENDTYRLCVGKDGQSRHISILDLDFVICSSGQYHWFRCRNAANLVKWLTVIQIRQGQE